MASMDVSVAHAGDDGSVPASWLQSLSQLPNNSVAKHQYHANNSVDHANNLVAEHHDHANNSVAEHHDHANNSVAEHHDHANNSVAAHEDGEAGPRQRECEQARPSKRRCTLGSWALSKPLGYLHKIDAETAPPSSPASEELEVLAEMLDKDREILPSDEEQEMLASILPSDEESPADLSGLSQETLKPAYLSSSWELEEQELCQDYELEEQELEDEDLEEQEMLAHERPRRCLRTSVPAKLWWTSPLSRISR